MQVPFEVHIIPHQYRNTSHAIGRKSYWSVRRMGDSLIHHSPEIFRFDKSEAVLTNLRFFETFFGHHLSLRQKLDFQIGTLIEGGLSDQERMPILLFVEVGGDSPLTEQGAIVDKNWLRFTPEIIDTNAAYSDMGMAYLPVKYADEDAISCLVGHGLFPIIVPVPEESLRAKMVEKYIGENGIAFKGYIEDAADTAREGD